MFCITIQTILDNSSPIFCVFYLDDGTVGGSANDALHDLELVEEEACYIGLHLNHEKTCEELHAGLDLRHVYSASPHYTCRDHLRLINLCKIAFHSTTASPSLEETHSTSECTIMVSHWQFSVQNITNAIHFFCYQIKWPIIA